ncbi:hypothetical protein EXW62_26810 (plasmid) [Bacillus mycoides]|uniref:hypothetical protein n=1 Tax=Bacillus mycoides TaxID=1405 RepID=UPI001C0204AF|nr:hypothetical protein [Bacillus mycoides]QWH20623.1 hypothetical protein EXW62_26810 [Bacillus mycoides]
MKKWAYSGLSALMLSGVIGLPSMASAEATKLDSNKSYYILDSDKRKPLTSVVERGGDWKYWDFLKRSSSEEQGKKFKVEYDTKNACYKIKMESPTYSGYDYVSRSSWNNVYLDKSSEASCWKMDGLESPYYQDIYTNTGTVFPILNYWTANSEDWIKTVNWRGGEDNKPTLWEFVPAD